jgi:hypothetical protein
MRVRFRSMVALVLGLGCAGMAADSSAAASTPAQKCEAKVTAALGKGDLGFVRGVRGGL